MAFFREDGGWVLPLMGRGGGGTPKIAAERKTEQGFHSGDHIESFLGCQTKLTHPPRGQNFATIILPPSKWTGVASNQKYFDYNSDNSHMKCNLT